MLAKALRAINNLRSLNHEPRLHLDECHIERESVSHIEGLGLGMVIWTPDGPYDYTHEDGWCDRSM